ncbi:MAG: hypothetical protein K2X47_10535 [Bdellovibrionales bacterium]|nr:hypothetical protein [Bdellovibrionales bacterium]
MTNLMRLVTIAFLISTAAFAGPQEELQRRATLVVSLAKDLESRSYQDKENPESWTVKSHSEKIDKIRDLIVEMLVISKANNIGSLSAQPRIRIWKPTDPQNLSVAHQGNVGLDLNYVSRAAGDTGFFPPQLDAAFRDVHNALYYSRSLVEIDRSYPLDVSLRSFLFELSGDLEQFATNAQVRSLKAKELLSILTTVPADILASYRKQIEAFKLETWKMIQAGDLEKTRGNFRKAKSLFVEIQGVFLNAKFTTLAGVEGVFGQKQEKTMFGETKYVPDLTKPLAAIDLAEAVRRLGELIPSENPQMRADWATLTFEFQVMSETGGPLKILQALRTGTTEGITKALAFFEPSGKENANSSRDIPLGSEVVALGYYQAPLFKDFFFPLILKTALSNQLPSHLAAKAKRILARWSQGTIKGEWIVSRLQELGKSGKPRLGYASVDAEAKDLFDFYYEKNNLGSGAPREAYFDGIGALCLDYPNLLGNYLAQNEDKKVYIHEVIAKRKHLNVLTDGVRLSILKLFFPNPEDKTRIEDRIDPRDLDAAIQMEILSLDDLMKMSVHSKDHGFQVKVSEILDEKINALPDTAERRRLRMSLLEVDLDNPHFCANLAAGRRPKSSW